MTTPDLEVVDGFRASPVQEKLLQSMRDKKNRIIGFGGAIRGTKTWGMLGALIIMCITFPRSRWAIVRKDLPTLRRNTIPSFNKLRPLFGGFVGTVNQGTWTAPCQNGSELIFFPESIDTDPELNRWKGLEVNGFALEEADELQERSYHKAIERAGTHIIVDGQQPPAYVLCTFNPNPFWPKLVFYDPWEQGALRHPYDFIPAGPRDNPWLPESQWEAWKEMPPLEYRRFVLMDWSVLVGRYYPSLNAKVHLIKRERLPKHIPEWWPAWGSFDWGFAHWSVFCLFVMEGETPVLVASLWLRHRQDKAMATEIVRFCKDHGLERALYEVYCGRDTFNKQRAHAASGKSCADIFALEGISCVPADDDRVNSGRAVRRGLEVTKAIGEDGQEELRAGVYIVEDDLDVSAAMVDGEPRYGNKRIWDQLTQTMPDPDAINEPLKVDADDQGRGGDDGENAFRFGVATRVPVAALPRAEEHVKREWEADKDEAVTHAKEAPPQTFVGGYPVDLI